MTFTPSHVVATYSIVARDPETGELGVAVQSHWFSVGTVVSWAEAGVGAVATQSLADPAYGPLGLDLMRAGRSAQQSLDALLAGDEEREGRQVAFVHSTGAIAVHTGSGCIAEAGHIAGDQFSVQANMMANDTVWDAMANAYRTADGDLAERMLVALEAAEAEGGDIRGTQSASLLVVAAESSGQPWKDRSYDLRIEDHATPIPEMRRLVRLRRAYLHMTAGDEALGRGSMDEALDQYARAENLVPEIVEMPFWKAVTLVGTGHLEDALPIFAAVFEQEPVWKELLPRVIDAGLLTVDDDTLHQILG
ncbi:MAG: DUF1028 domain-containing protein [Acidobacteria bacterium]|nr:DUF1028 domain-containing protein [Acidobacteriota bacterium]